MSCAYEKFPKFQGDERGSQAKRHPRGLLNHVQLLCCSYSQYAHHIQSHPPCPMQLTVSTQTVWPCQKVCRDTDVNFLSKCSCKLPRSQKKVSDLCGVELMPAHFSGGDVSFAWFWGAIPASLLVHNEIMLLTFGSSYAVEQSRNKQYKLLSNDLLVMSRIINSVP